MNNKINLRSGLTEKEEEISSGINRIHQLFEELPVQHQDDIKECVTGIHILQGLLMQRIARRYHPKYWRNDEKNK